MLDASQTVSEDNHICTLELRKRHYTPPRLDNLTAESPLLWFPLSVRLAADRLRRGFVAIALIEHQVVHRVYGHKRRPRRRVVRFSRCRIIPLHLLHGDQPPTATQCCTAEVVHHQPYLFIDVEVQGRGRSNPSAEKHCTHLRPRQPGNCRASRRLGASATPVAGRQELLAVGQNAQCRVRRHVVVALPQLHRNWQEVHLH